MSKSSRTIRALGVALVALPLALGVAAPASAVTPPAGAFAEGYGAMVDLTALAGSVPVKQVFGAASSSCPVTGGTKTNALLDQGDPAAVKVAVLKSTATADCGAKSATTVAQVANVDALGAVPQVKVHADAVTSTSTTTCEKDPQGSTRIVGLSIGGNNIPVPEVVTPNFVVLDPVLSVFGLKVILNEQHPSAQGRGLVVNGIHIIASASGAVPVGGTVIRGDVVISHAVSGVVCPGGPGSVTGGLPKPDITFYKSATPSVVVSGDTVTYSALVSNTSTTACEVLKFVEHVAPAFSIVSSSGPLGTKLDTPAPTRTDGGVDAVLRPTGVKIAPGKSITQTFTVTVKPDATPGTYYDELEIYCGPNGNFVSGPMAPVTVTVPGAPPVLPPDNPVVAPPTVTPPAFGHTGLSTGLAGTALLLLLAGAAARRFQTRSA